MGEIIQEEKGKKGGKRKVKKQSTRIDMTPMVDLMCLLITFFMLTTAFSKAKVMVITMPEKDVKDEPKNKPQIAANRTLNILLTGGDKVYFYQGLADPKKPPLPELIKSDFSKDGIRKVLLLRNKELFTKIAEYREKRLTGKMVVADTTADNAIKNFKKEDRKGPIVLIKADDKTKYKDIVNIIDEMAICNIASYAVVDLSPVEIEMLKNAPK
ncbi:MAG: biopolymer transporter ExbD [Bacteroidales bacterium]|nr:biopolymer transporter ExbD [Bacteroidales bacterium]MDD4603175.1 biopolymer transporter ExbD [Bacteroidales bacterium]